MQKSERRRWLFRKQSNSNAAQAPVMAPEQRHAIAVEMIRPCPKAAASYKHETAAARVIQTAFRGYLARRALVALKGIVKLQALIRGQNVRKQANMTMKCMQSLLRVRARLSHDAGRRSMFAETTNLWESKYLRDRNSRSREGSCVTDEWRPAPECPRTLEELEAILKARNEAALAHEKSSLPFAFAQQVINQSAVATSWKATGAPTTETKAASWTTEQTGWINGWPPSSGRPAADPPPTTAATQSKPSKSTPSKQPTAADPAARAQSTTATPSPLPTTDPSRRPRHLSPPERDRRRRSARPAPSASRKTGATPPRTRRR
ncbi:hypothetical protein SASPL_130716 [Salvia splendens]|uniref:DUF4005 domain-containing protein n=1 Tax=Salvia splendens TaxID=180675 RepID=A0A8X8X7S9_SALSN|nr:hypothetical protein SASPL_130716 [Salvia splendens]